MKHLLEVINLTKSYDTKTVVKGISFSVKSGEILGFLGPNGAGKSTTLHMISTLLDSSEGKIMFNGKPITDHNYEYKKAL